jgi:hypothetical protein
MKAKEAFPDLPNYSFLVDRQFFHFDDYCHSVCLLSFGYYDEKDKFCYMYHLLVDDIFIRAFTDYYMAVDYLRKFA